MSEDKKQSIRVALLGNEPIPMLCIVAVLCLRGREFKEFERKNRKENERFVWIYDNKQVYGRLFDRIEKVRDWYDMNNASEIAEALEIRLRSNYT
jgi:hypothetical protein